MKWKKFRLKTLESAEDIVISALYDCGIEGAQIEDKAPLTESEKAQMFVDIAPVPETDDGIAWLDFYLDPEKDDVDGIMGKVRRALDELREFCDIGTGTLEISETEDTDWINNWKQYFKQFYIDDILVIPSWEQVKDEDRDKMILHIDPGTAFGTGMHETTQLCIRQLKKYVTSETRLLDVGTGSGILSIIALKLGAAHAVGTDLDPCAVPAVADNKKANGIPEDAFDMIIGNLIDDPEIQRTVGENAYDLVTANILADVLVPLMPAVARAVKPDGVCITSGILQGQEQKVIRAAEKAGLHLVETTQQGEWMSVTVQRQSGMYRFFVEKQQIRDGVVKIDGEDVRHIRSVLRMRPGKQILVACGDEWEYTCQIEHLSEEEVTARVLDAQKPGKELPSRITLFQCLPKSDKMETVIQKAVELGAYAVAPVVSKRCVVKLDARRAANKAVRWNTVAASAAKQSKRMIVPEVKPLCSFQDALREAQDMDVRLIPYENAEGMAGTRKVFSSIRPGDSVAVLIGPEGGFDETEVEEAQEAGFLPVTLGKRILRTETAGMTVLSILMYLLETD